MNFRKLASTLLVSSVFSFRSERDFFTKCGLRTARWGPSYVLWRQYYLPAGIYQRC